MNLRSIMEMPIIFNEIIVRANLIQRDRIMRVVFYIVSMYYMLRYIFHIAGIHKYLCLLY